MSAVCQGQKRLRSRRIGIAMLIIAMMHGNRRRAVHQQLLLIPVAFTFYIDSQLLAVSGFPVAQIGFDDHMGRIEYPA